LFFYQAGVILDRRLYHVRQGIKRGIGWKKNQEKSGNVDGNVFKPHTNFGNHILKTEIFLVGKELQILYGAR
jgi:hypothetical protein